VHATGSEVKSVLGSGVQAALQEAHQGLAMMQMANNGNIPDELRVVHQPRQKLIAVVCLEGLLLEHLSFLGFDGSNDGNLHSIWRCCQAGKQDFVLL